MCGITKEGTVSLIIYLIVLQFSVMTKSSKLNYNYYFYYFFLHRYDIVRFVWTLVLVGWFCIRIQMAKLNKMYSSS